jgi:branched-chain amino acid transport system substrate-binding protein
MMQAESDAGEGWATIRIGVIAADSENYAAYNMLFKEILEPDLNEEFTQLTFIFHIEDARESTGRHLGMIKSLHRTLDTELFIGGGWSDQAEAALEYIDTNNLLLFSPSSTRVGLAIPDDCLFRLAPDDMKQSKAIAEMIWSRGMESVVVIHRNDEWGNGLSAAFESEYQSVGGAVLGKFGYSQEVSDFTPIFEAAEELLTGAVNEGVLLLGFAEGKYIIQQAEAFPEIYGLTWFGSESLVTSSDDILESSSAQACQLKLLSTYPAPEYSPEYYALSARYEALVGEPLDFYRATCVDIAYIVTLSAIETHSISAPAIMGALPDIASSYFGITGGCALNEAGDRCMSNFDILGYDYVEGEPTLIKYGFYSSATGTVEWYD